ncbi:hypothetical protein TWF730_002690 [Orbilia blumenaviensis]|uniref:DUF7136 domain-containing protein n=1 Tax=Orbilia blumenaviensis TaxID=1796055 RepID=A0AAV9U7N5_9PEZI
MRLISPTFWSLVGMLACLGPSVEAVAAGALEVSVVFPRINETYAPASMFPIVYGLENAELAKNLNLVINSYLRGGPAGYFGNTIYNIQKTYGDFSRSKKPYLVYMYLRLENEGDYELESYVHWSRCGLSGNNITYLFNNTLLSKRVPFYLKEGGRGVNLVEITADENPTCSAPTFSIDIGTETQEVIVPDPVTGTCAVISSTPTLALNPCRVKIDAAADESMLAAVLAANCGGSNPPPACPKEGSAAQKLAIGGVAGLAAVLGAVGLLLA